MMKTSEPEKDLPTSTSVRGTLFTPIQVLMTIGVIENRNTITTLTSRCRPNQRMNSGRNATSGVASSPMK